MRHPGKLQTTPNEAHETPRATVQVWLKTMFIMQCLSIIWTSTDVVLKSLAPVPRHNLSSMPPTPGTDLFVYVQSTMGLGLSVLPSFDESRIDAEVCIVEVKLR